MWARQACTYMSSQITCIFPQHHPDANGNKKEKRVRFRQVSTVKKVRGGKTFCRGVDLTDTTKYFSYADFKKMGPEGREYLNKCPKRKVKKEEKALQKRGK